MAVQVRPFAPSSSIVNKQRPNGAARSLHILRLVGVAALVTIVPLVLAALASPGVATATFPGANGRIAMSYPACGWGDPAIFTMRPDGSRLRRLKGTGCGSGSATHPDWSPDGRRLLYHHEVYADDTGRIWVMNADGSGKRRVPLRGVTPPPPPGSPDYYNDFRDVNTAYAPSFSPDGQHFAYMRGGWRWREEESLTPRIWTAKLDGSADRRLRAGGGRPRWSPDGRSIASRVSVGCDLMIRLISPRTGRQQRLIAERKDACAEPSLGASEHFKYGDTLDWSPDGRQLLYMPVNDGGIWAVGADGTGSRRLLQLPDLYIRTAVWSPDGRRIAFTATRGAGYDEGDDSIREQHSIWTVSVAGTGLKKLWEGPKGGFYPSLTWQPRPR